jgi:UDP-glucose 4-epimerase
VQEYADLSGARALVTGASGFIGQHLCRALLEHGATVHGISRGVQTDTNGVRWWQADVSEHDSLASIFDQVRPDYVFDLASEVTGARDRRVVMPTLHSNLVSTVNVLDLATEYDCKRVVVIGSLEEPQWPDSVPSSPYAAAKAASSIYAAMFHNLYQTPVVNARLFMVYGPAQVDTTKLIPYVTLTLLRGEVPRMSSGARPVDWVYVGDVVEGLVRCAVVPDAAGQTVDIGSGQLVTIRQVVEMLGEIIAPGAELGFGALPDRPFEQVRTANVAEAQSLIGWMPQVSLEDGLRRTVDYYRTLT